MTIFHRVFCFPVIFRSGARLNRRTRHCLSDRAGTAAIEFAIVLPVFLLFIFGTLEIGRFMWSEHALDYASEQASRYALANPSASLADIQSFAETQVMTVNDSEVTVLVVSETLDGIDYLKVTVTHLYKTLLPLVPFGPFTLTRVARIPVVS